MVKGQNWNRPQQGDQIKVEPIRKRKDIENIKKLLADNARLRIPMISAGDSDGRRPAVPRQGGRF